MKNKKFLLVLIVLVLATLLLTACGGPNPMENVANEAGKVAGFFKGFWDGLTVVISFIASIFAPDRYGIYEVHNSGFGYNFGFIMGIIFNFAAAKISD